MTRPADVAVNDTHLRDKAQAKDAEAPICRARSCLDR